MKIKFYILIIFLHVLILSGCGISKNESSLIIDAPANSKVERTIKNFIPHYEITFPEEDNHLSIIKIPIKPSDEFITTFLDTFAKNFKDELIKQLEPTGIKLEEIKNPITKQVRYLNKLVDELAKGRELDKILRK